MEDGEVKDHLLLNDVLRILKAKGQISLTPIQQVHLAEEIASDYQMTVNTTRALMDFIQGQWASFDPVTIRTINDDVITWLAQTPKGSYGRNTK